MYSSAVCSEVHRNPLCPPTVAGSQSEPPATKVRLLGSAAAWIASRGRLIEPTCRKVLVAALKTWAPALD